MPWRILLISDSRGGGLATEIRRNIDIDFIWEERVHKGATLDDILKKIERSQRKQRSTTWDIILVVAGICNLTKRVLIKKGTQYLEYKERKAEHTNQVIDQLLDTNGDRIHICTIPPADLGKYSSYRDDDPTLKQEQGNLIEDLEQINRHIISRNILRDFATVDLAKQTYSSSLKKQGSTKKRVSKFTGKGLRDGLHPDPEARKAWATYMAKVIPKIATKIQEKLNQKTTAEETEDSDSESDREDNWDYKRSKKPRTTKD